MRTETLTMRLERDEALLLHQSLNEVCNGFGLDDFPAKIGIDEGHARSMMESLAGPIKTGASSVRYQWTPQEIRALCRVLEEVMLELGEDEFDLRTGFSLDQARTLQQALSASLPHEALV